MSSNIRLSNSAIKSISEEDKVNNKTSSIPWGMQINTLQPSSFAGITDEKMKSFTIGTQKKISISKT
jgi:hypothetical protein